jgi:hypothetical protein
MRAIDFGISITGHGDELTVSAPKFPRARQLKVGLKGGYAQVRHSYSIGLSASGK